MVMVANDETVMVVIMTIEGCVPIWWDAVIRCNTQRPCAKHYTSIQTNTHVRATKASIIWSGVRKEHGWEGSVIARDFNEWKDGERSNTHHNMRMRSVRVVERIMGSKIEKKENIRHAYNHKSRI